MIIWNNCKHPMRMLRLQLIERENKEPKRPRMWIHGVNHELKRRIHTFYIKKARAERLAAEAKKARDAAIVHTDKGITIVK